MRVRLVRYKCKPIVAVQRTGVYSIPLYDILEERALNCTWSITRHTKNLPGRKSDVQGQWLLKLHMYGLLNNSLQEIQRAIIAGERDGLKLARFRDPRLKASEEEIAKSLEDN